MKKLLFLLSIMCFTVIAKAQVVPYTPMKGLQITYAKVDSGFAIPVRDTVLGRNVNRPGLFVCRPQDSLLYYYNGVNWELVQGAGGDYSNKVDSVTIAGDYLFYWINGASFGYLLPTAGWGLSGNPGCDGCFIGTTANYPLRFYYYDTIRAVIDTGGLFGIGTEHPDKILDVSSTSSGILIPRLTTAQMNAIVTPLTGELIYNTTADSVYFYSGGGIWKPVGTGAASPTPDLQDVTDVDNTTTNNILIDPGLGNSLDLGSSVGFRQVSGSRSGALTKLFQTGNHVWSLPDATGTIALTTNISTLAWNKLGDAGTTAGTHFLGTTDNIDLIFKRNSLQSGRIGLTSTSFGKSSLLSTATGVQNSAFGANSLTALTTGFNNASFGYINLVSTTSGAANSAFGTSVLNANTTGSFNSGYGTSTLAFNTTGTYNTAIGNAALGSNTVGAKNLGLGTHAGGYNTTDSNRIFINTIDRLNKLGDTTKSPIYIAQDATAGSQRAYINAKTYIPYMASGVGTKAVRINPGTGELTYADTTTGGGSSTVIPSIMNFRLTTESGVPVSITDRTAQSTIYLTPYIGNHISLYSGAAWVDHTTAEISLALSGLTSGKNYDVFAYNNAGTITLELSAAWTNDNTRADAVTRQDGILVKSGATTRRLIGTIRTTSTTTTEDSEGGTTTQVGGKRFVWNLYNQVRRTAKVVDKTDSWSYTTATWRQENGNAGNQVEYVTGDASLLVDAMYNAMVLVTNTSVNSGIGISSTTVPSGFSAATYNSGTIALFQAVKYVGTPGLGYFYVAALEKGQGSGTSSWYGDNGTTDSQSGLSIIITN